MPELLETALAMTVEPGTNLKGQAAGANWTFLLPSRELEQIVCIGLPSASSMATISHLGGWVTIAHSSQEHIQKANELWRLKQFSSIRMILAKDRTELPLPSDRVDLVFITEKDARWQLNNSRIFQEELHRILKPKGVIYYESSKIVDFVPDKTTDQSLVEKFGGSALIWLAPVKGELQSAVPAHDREAINYFIHHQLSGTSVNLKALKPLRWVINQRNVTIPRNGEAHHTSLTPKGSTQSPIKASIRSAGLRTQATLEHAERFLISQKIVANRHGVFLGRSVANMANRPPQYLCSIARQAGVDIDNCKWGLSAPGDYNSRKVLFFLFNRKKGARKLLKLDYIAKTVRDPGLNHRLENEHRTLKILQERGIGTRETVPQIAFFGYHNDLAIVGETSIEGTPFRQRTTTTTDCPYAQAVIDWLTYLGEASVDFTTATAGQVAEGLDTLFKRFSQIYHLSPAHYDFMAKQIAVIRATENTFPLLLQHGDPGPWNVLVTPGGDIAFLDWEAAEIKGMPLWDMFYFLRSYCMEIARANGIHDRLDGFTQLFLTESPFNQLVAKSAKQYCQLIGLAQELVEPLFYTCWMHRALKESSRLTYKRVESGHYVNLLRLCIEQRKSSTFGHLFKQATVN